MLFYIKYGCSIRHETLVVEADNFERADLYAEQAAQECYWSYDCNYPSDEDYEGYSEEGYSEEEMSNIMEQEMYSDIDWVVEPFDEKNEDHMDALRDCGAPYEV